MSDHKWTRSEKGHYSEADGRFVAIRDTRRIKGHRWYLIDLSSDRSEVFDASTLKACKKAASEIDAQPGLDARLASRDLDASFGLGEARKAGRSRSGRSYHPGDQVAWRAGERPVIVEPADTWLEHYRAHRAQQRALDEIRREREDIEIRLLMEDAARLRRLEGLRRVRPGIIKDHDTGALVQGSTRVDSSLRRLGLRAWADVTGTIHTPGKGARRFAVRVDLPDDVNAAELARLSRIAITAAIDNPQDYPHPADDILETADDEEVTRSAAAPSDQDRDQPADIQRAASSSARRGDRAQHAARATDQQASAAIGIRTAATDSDAQAQARRAGRRPVKDREATVEHGGARAAYPRYTLRRSSQEGSDHKRTDYVRSGGHRYAPEERAGESSAPGQHQPRGQQRPRDRRWAILLAEGYVTR